MVFGKVKVTDENAHLLGGIIEQTYKMAEECLKTNYYRTKRVSEALLPLLQLSNSPRIVNMSSVYGQLSVSLTDPVIMFLFVHCLILFLSVSVYPQWEGQRRAGKSRQLNRRENRRNFEVVYEGLEGG